MAGPARSKKRTNDNKVQRPAKKQKRSKQKHYNSDSEEEEDAGFDPVNLLDSDDDIHNATIEDAASDDGDAASSEGGQNLKKPAPKAKGKMTVTSKKSSPPQDQAEESDSGSENDSEGSEDDQDPSNQDQRKMKNDNSAFATSLTKILGTKLTTSKRSDPVLSRSVEAHEASRQMLDDALEAKAKKQMRDTKRRAFEKGRVTDVLVATRDEKTGELESSTGEIMETERRLRKTAQRGVVKLFNAVRAAQVAGTEAEKGTRAAGVLGMKSREGKVNELSKKGFLDLIASGGGGLKKGAAAIEEG